MLGPGEVLPKGKADPKFVVSKAVVISNVISRVTRVR